MGEGGKKGIARTDDEYGKGNLKVLGKSENVYKNCKKKQEDNKTERK